MRSLIFSLSLILGLFISTANADMKWSSQNPNAYDVTNTLTDKHAENFMHVISNLPWTEEGLQQTTGKFIYVLYFPECPASKDFYKETRKYLDQVTIRWIPFTGDDHVSGLYETRTPDALKTAFTREILPKIIDQKMTDSMVNSMVSGLVMFQMGKMIAPDGNMYFPTVIYGDEKNAWVSIAPADVKALIKKIPVTSPTATPLMVEKVKDTIQLEPLKKPMDYQNTKDDFADVYLFPSKDGIRMAGFDKNVPPLPISGYTEEGFIAIDLTGNENYLFIHDEAFVKANFPAK